jgi:hypothetical protein
MAADVVVGIATYNDADRIGQALRAIVSQCEALGGSASCLIVQADGSSTDGTAERASEVTSTSVPLQRIGYLLEGIDKVSGPYRAVPAKGNAVRTVFREARRIGAKACVIVDVDVENFSEGWLDGMLRPVLVNGVDFVAPRYAVRRLAGTMNSGLAYPLTRALYGKRVRYPLGGDLACSMAFMDRVVDDPAWDSDTARSSVDLWLTTRAAAGGMRIGEAWLGAKRQVWRDAGGDMAQPLAKVLAALFGGAERWQSTWQKVRGSTRVDVVQGTEAVDVAEVPVDIRQGMEGFRLAQRHLDELWRLVLPPRTLLDLKKLAVAPDESFRLADDVWARIVYDFMLAYHHRSLGREHVLTAFAPLFGAWVSSFVAEVMEATPAQVEERLEQLCLRFEGEKPYLISRWRWPDRFNP